MSFRQIPEIDSFFPKSQIAENDSVMFFYRRPSRKTTNYSTKRSERSYMQKIVVRDTFFHNKNSVSVDIAKARESFLMRKKLRTISQDANNPNFQKLKTKKSKVLSKTLLIEKKSTIIRKEKDSTFLSAKPKPLELNLNVFPNWLTERLDFQTSLQTSESPIDISKVASIFPAYYRSDTEKEALFNWVNSTKFFSKIPSSITKEICDRLTRHDFEIGDQVIKKGEIGDCCYIIYKGKAGIFFDSEIPNSVICAGEVIGEHALDTEKPRSADVKCLEHLITFKLKKIDYDGILINFKKLEKHETTKFLMSVDVFKP